jgi:uncharacterized phage-like protein YoqJ
MRVAVTGHRPNKLGGDYTGEGTMAQKVRQWLRRQLEIRKPDEAVTGMALGVDQWFAEEALRLDIDVYACIPCDGQERLWPTPSQDRYHLLLNHPKVRTNVVHPGPYAAWKMQKRNQYMVDYSHILLAVWDGTHGGTGNCVGYAERCGKPVARLDPFA